MTVIARIKIFENPYQVDFPGGYPTFSPSLPKTSQFFDKKKIENNPLKVKKYNNILQPLFFLNNLDHYQQFHIHITFFYFFIFIL